MEKQKFKFPLQLRKEKTRSIQLHKSEWTDKIWSDHVSGDCKISYKTPFPFLSTRAQLKCQQQIHTQEKTR